MSHGVGGISPARWFLLTSLSILLHWSCTIDKLCISWKEISGVTGDLRVNVPFPSFFVLRHLRGGRLFVF